MTIDDLAAYGANVDEGLARCVGNVDFYLMLVGTVVDAKEFAELSAALEAGDLDTAFSAAHALKGTLGNLALTPLCEPMSEITELLRARTDMDYSELMGRITQALEGLRAIA